MEFDNEKFLDKWFQKLEDRISELPGMAVEAVIKKPKCPRLKFAEWMRYLENDNGGTCLCDLENGATVGYMSDLGNCPEVFHGEIKQRVRDEQRQFRGNYKTGLVKEVDLQKNIYDDLEEGLVSGSSSESELMCNPPPNYA